MSLGPNDPPPTWPMMKVAQADAHGHRLFAETQLWAASNPLSYVPTISEDRLSWVLRVRLLRPPPTEQWSLVVGDCVHNLRSALDAMVWHYATLNGNRPQRPERVQFPIETEANKWDRARADRLQGVSDEVADRIRTLQPFMVDDPQAHFLILLRELSNHDKHRSSVEVRLEPHQIAHSVGMEFYSPSAAARAGAPAVDIKSDELRDGMVILEVNVTEPIAKVTGGYQAGFVVTLDTPTGPGAAVQTLGQLADTVRKALTVIYAGGLPGQE